MILRWILLLVLFLVVGVLLTRYARRHGPFGNLVAALVLGVLFLKVLFPGAVLPGGFLVPGIAMVVVGSSNPLPLPATAFWGYMLLIVIGSLLNASSNDDSLWEFMEPVTVFLRGEFGRAGRIVRHATLWAALPLLVGWLILRGFMPSSQPPLESRMAHPSLSYNADWVNPLRNPNEQTLADYAASNGLTQLSRQELSANFREAMLLEGRHLYGKYCSHCHGGKADGGGHLARALRLRPANFNDAGTIATLVEGYAFQRIMDGGIRLPGSGTPWDSAMPAWKNTLSEEDVYKILLAEYDLADVSPRALEKSE